MSNPANTESSIFLEIPPDQLINDGSLADVREWFYSYVPLPMIYEGDRIQVLSSFDNQHGGLGLDNIHLSTPQVYDIKLMLINFIKL